MTRTAYYTSQSRLSQAPAYVTDDLEAAMQYLPTGHGWLHTVEVAEGMRVADEQDVMALAPEDCPYSSAWEVIEQCEGVLATLREQYDAVEYEDMTPDNEREHDTLHVFAPSQWMTITAVRHIEPVAIEID